MARIKLDIPDNHLTTVSIPVRITDINYGNHVGNDSFVAIIHEARMLWLKQYGYTELAIEGIGLIMSDLVVEFKQEAVYGDIIRVDLFAGEITRAGFEIYYRLTTVREEKENLLAHAKTGMVCYDYAAKRVAMIPDSLKAILNA